MANEVNMVEGGGAGTMNINPARKVRSVSGAKRKKQTKRTSKRKRTSRKTRKRSK